MKRAVVFLVFLLVVSPIQHRLFAQANDVHKVVELLNQGEIQQAQLLLQNNLQTNPEDIDSRLLLGTVSDFLGETEEALRIWSSGINGTDNDYALYMSIGEIRLRLGIKGNNYHYVKGKIQGIAEKDSIEDHRYRNQQLNLAVSAFQKATDYYPYESDAWENLANAYQQLNHYEMALRCWEHLNEVYPQNDNFKVKLAYCRLHLGHLLESKRAFDMAISLNARLHEAYAGLAQYYLEKGEINEAEVCIQKSEFYKWLPSFCSMTYSTERYDIFETLAQPEEEQLLDTTLQRPTLIKQLLTDKTEDASEFLAVLCWYDEDKPALSSQMFEALSRRKLTGARLLIAKNSENVYVITECVKKLVRMDAPGTFDLLVSLLPQDKQPYQHMDIPSYMAQLGDDRAILYLVKELNPKIKQAEIKESDTGEENYEALSLQSGVQAARRRAALALSAFNHPAAISALQEGLNNENVNVYCSASLYKLTGETKYLAVVENFTDNQKKDKLLAQFFSGIDTKQASKLTKKLN
jgi:tetratricopeptide (TPR) repeat protein